MEILNENIELIERYMDGNLSEEEKLIVESKIANNPAFADEVELRKEINEAILEADVDDFKEKLEIVFQDQQEQNKVLEHFKSILYGKKKMLVASMLLLVIAISGIFLITNKNDMQYVIDNYYQPYEAKVLVRSDDTNPITIMLNTAMQKYEEQEYYEAVGLFEEVLKMDNKNIQGHLFSGISNFEIEEYLKANESFNYIINDNNNLYIDQAKWYLGFCYLEMEDKEKALDLFQNISESDSYYKETAKKIVSKLK
ncbi:MAG: hypothetical protein U9R42_02860 [Bacteroidota bacterium]|nr:hypothetical protein [Bacteroidota bacterium]